jgi:hypothetical protein
MSDHISSNLTYGFPGSFIGLCKTGSTRYHFQCIHRTLKQETRFGQPREDSAGCLVKIPPYLVVHRPFQGTDTNLASLQAGPHPHAVLYTLDILGYGAMHVYGWMDPHQDKLPSLTLPNHFVSLKDIWPVILWDESDDDIPTTASFTIGKDILTFNPCGQKLNHLQTSHSSSATCLPIPFFISGSL